MHISLPSIASALAGGALIGVSASIMLHVVGRVAGISGIVGGLARPRTEIGWRASFLGGLLLGGCVLALVAPAAVASAAPATIGWVLLAGVLVGVGTQLGNGCTSGHGVCGISRLSPRSLAATITFMLTGVGAAVITRQLLAGAP